MSTFEIVMETTLLNNVIMFESVPGTNLLPSKGGIAVNLKLTH